MYLVYEGKRSICMTFYDLIRAALIKDAEQHPYPGKRCEPGQSSTERHEGTEQENGSEGP